MSSLVPSENWPPYRWLWTHLVLARNYDGSPAPYTHGVRRNKAIWVPIFAALLVVMLVQASSRWWRVLLAAALGFLAGHFFWCGS